MPLRFSLPYKGASDVLLDYICPNPMYLGCEFGELAIILHGGLIYCDYFETFSEYSGTHKIGFAYCPRLVV